MIQSFADQTTADLFADQATRHARRMPSQLWPVIRPKLKWLILGKRGVTADTALCLASRFGTSAQLWMHLQADWDLQQAIRKRSAA